MVFVCLCVTNIVFLWCHQWNILSPFISWKCLFISSHCGIKERRDLVSFGAFNWSSYIMPQPLELGTFWFRIFLLLVLPELLESFRLQWCSILEHRVTLAGCDVAKYSWQSEMVICVLCIYTYCRYLDIIDHLVKVCIYMYGWSPVKKSV